MKVTAPHFGNVHLAAKALFDGLGIEYVMPPMNNKIALELGSKNSPEEMCLPYKIMMGNFFQAMELGADTAILPGSCGPCRFGKYAELQMNTFKSLGRDLDFVVIDSPVELGLSELFNRINKISSHSKESRYGQIKSLLKAKRVMNLIDEIESRAHFLSGYEKNKGEAKDILSRCKNDALEASCPDQMIRVMDYYRNKQKSIEVDRDKRPIKIAIIGEIYTIIEPFSNFNLEDKLMDYGVTFSRKLTPSWWMKDLMLKPLGLNSLKINQKAKDYLPLGVGGHGKECVGEAVLAREEGYDGAIQVFPLGCMPEIVSKSILPTISADLDFPIMSLVVDEMSGEAGFVTRVEAFIDLLERRRANELPRA
ncbi:MAG: CoA protein activase [Tissierellaceae bacterium]